MKKLILFIGCGLLLTIAANAQNHVQPVGSELSIGLDGALPMNGWDINDGQGTKLTNFGIGATIKYAYSLNESIAATFQTGFIYFPGKNLGGGKVNFSQVPFKGGIRFSKSNFYFEPQLGFSSLTFKAVGSGSSGSASTTAFTYAIGVGTRAGRDLDIGLRYEAMSKDGTMGFMALRVAYIFPFDK